jgi:hypothetical protein
LNRDEAVLVVQELLGSCPKMDGVYLCMVPPTGETPIVTQGYQLHIKASSSFDKETVGCIETITKKHHLSAQEFKDEEKMIIYRQH